MSRLEDAASHAEDMAVAAERLGSGWWADRGREMRATAALLRAIDQIPRFGVGSIASDIFEAALALADTLLPTEGTKP